MEELLSPTEELQEFFLHNARNELDSSRASERAHERSPLLSRGGTEGSHDNSSGSARRKASIAYLLPSVVLMAASFGSIVPVKVEIYNWLVCKALRPRNADIAAPAVGLLAGIDMDVCRRDPQVQRAVTALSLGMTLLAGVLSSLTAGYWGSRSDRRGRKPVLGLTQVGLLLSEIVFVGVVLLNDRLPYRMLLLGPAIDGLFGGFAVVLACYGAYISDCTPQGSRASAFSFLMAAMLGGYALGPSFGALLVRISSTVLMPFYVALGVHVFNLVFTIFVLPESRSAEAMFAARERHEADIKMAAAEGRPPFWGRIRKNASAFLAPLVIFLPRTDAVLADDQRALLRPIRRRSYALTALSISYFFSSMSMAVYSVKLQYAQFMFNWTPQQNGALLTLAGICRCFVLIVVLPLLSKALRARPAALQGSKSSQEDRAEFQAKLLHDSRLDLLLARLAFVCDLVGYLTILSARTTVGFIIGTALASLGAGAGPAIQSLALTLSSPDDAGRLLAALSVLQSLSAQVAGPLIFNATFAATIEWFAPAVFALAACIFVLAFLALVFLEKPRARHDSTGMSTTLEASDTTNDFIDLSLPRSPARPTRALADARHRWMHRPLAPLPASIQLPHLIESKETTQAGSSSEAVVAAPADADIPDDQIADNCLLAAEADAGYEVMVVECEIPCSGDPTTSGLCVQTNAPLTPLAAPFVASPLVPSPRRSAGCFPFEHFQHFVEYEQGTDDTSDSEVNEVNDLNSRLTATRLRHFRNSGLESPSSGVFDSDDGSDQTGDEDELIVWL